MIVRSGDVDLVVYESGPAEAPTVVLIHGYPDSAAVWSKVAEQLSTDFHVVAYDVRGAGQSTAPRGGRRGYRLEHLVADFEAVIDATSPDRAAHVVAHDWGSIQAWHAVTEPRLQDRIASFTSISGPSIDHVGYWMRERIQHPTPAHLGQLIRQMVRSFYVAAFQLPGVGALMGAVGPQPFATYRRLVEGYDAPPSTTVAADLRHGVQLYRANMPAHLRAPVLRTTQLPVQVVALLDDRFVTPALTLGVERFAPNLWRREVHGHHWSVAAHPARTATWVREFVRHVQSGSTSRALQRARVGVPQPRFANDVVVITGTGSGFGRATALAFAQRGATIVGADINGEAAEATASLCRQHGVTASARTVDVSNVDDMELWAKDVLAEFGVPDVVINNAGIAIAGSMIDMTADDWDRILGVNLQGVIHGCRLFGKAMVERGEGGHIVNIASAAGFGPIPSITAYATTKAAVLQLSRSMRGELAPDGIGVTAICPGFSATNIGASAQIVGMRGASQRLREMAFRRTRSPEKVARSIVRAVERNQEVVPTGGDAHAVRALNRLSPAAVSAIGRMIGRVQHAGGVNS